jgi:hypothetical protein
MQFVPERSQEFRFQDAWKIRVAGIDCDVNDLAGWTETANAGFRNYPLPGLYHHIHVLHREHGS